MIENIYAKAKRTQRHIVLSEGEDPRVIKAAIAATKLSLAKITLIGDPKNIDAMNIDIQHPMNSIHREELAKFIFEKRKHKGITLKNAADAINEPHVFAAAMVAAGLADGTLGGAITTTADIVKAALQIIGIRSDAKLASSFFLMILDKKHHTKKGVFIFTDCGLVIDPNAAQLSEIAQASAHSYQTLLNQDPRVAMLSFSTHGSAQHPTATKVIEATNLIKQIAPHLIVDGEMQFDAAFVPDVASLKVPNSPLEGNANVFVFPSLEAGNIAYKIAQRIGGAQAIGPILQGINKPANDLSRGCSIDDIIQMIAVTAAQCE